LTSTNGLCVCLTGQLNHEKMLTLTKKLRREQESKDDQSRATGDAFESNNNEVLAAQQRVKRVSVRDRLLVKEVSFVDFFYIHC